MTTTSTKYLYLCTALFMTTALSSCSRPVAYFQRESLKLATIANSQPVDVPTLNQAIASPIKPITTTSQFEAYVRNDNKLALRKTLRKRMDKVETLLVSTLETLEPSVNYSAHKVNMVERLMVKKMNKRNHQQLAPDEPKKAMGDRIKLFGGILLLVVGAVIMIAGAKPILFLGLILALAGVVGIIAGLFGIS